MIFTLSLFVYLYTIDSIIAVLIKHILGIESIFNYIILLFVRILFFYFIGLLVGLNQLNNFIIAVIIAFLIFLFEFFKFLNTAKEEI